MSTTTIRLEEGLKNRINDAAAHAGKTAHAFILEAIAQTVEQVEQDKAFHTLADERWARICATGESVAWDDAKSYLAARAEGKHPRKPAARVLGK